MENYISIILGVVAVLVTFLSYYLAVKTKIQGMASDAINYAEELSKIGEQKMKIAVDQVYNMIPTILKPVFSKDFIQQIIQEVFDKMKAFAEKKNKIKIEDGQ